MTFYTSSYNRRLLLKSVKAVQKKNTTIRTFSVFLFHFLLHLHIKYGFSFRRTIFYTNNIVMDFNLGLGIKEVDLLASKTTNTAVTNTGEGLLKRFSNISASRSKY